MYTTFTIDLISKYLEGVKSVVDFGSQNLSNGIEPPPFVNEWYKEKGIKIYECIDLAGDNKAMQLDLSKPILHGWHGFDLVADIGTSEHVVKMDGFKSFPFYDGYINSIYPTIVESIEEGYYNCWWNKHNLCKVDGLIISENPKTGNWPEHGYTYLTQEFYEKLASMTNYEIMELGEHAASGNDVDGWEIYCVLKKHSDKFPSFDEFENLPIKQY